MAANKPPQRLYESSGEFSWATFRQELLQSTLTVPYDIDPRGVEFSRRLTVYRLMLLVMIAALVVIIVDTQSALGNSFLLLAAASTVEVVLLVITLWVFRHGSFLLPPIMPLLATLTILIWSVISGNAQHYYWLFPLLLAVAGLLPTSVGLLVGTMLALCLLVVRALGLSQWPVSTDFILLVTMVGLLGLMRLMSRQSAELADLALMDPLTGAYNRRYLTPQAQRNLADFERYARLSTLVLLDIDHFKSINDYHGHAAGDRVLQRVVNLISDRIRGVDMLFRLGGEEFVILLSDVASHSAAKIAEELRITIKTLKLLPDREVTVSIGVCDVAQAQSATHWLEQVDSAMYRAKQSGRDRVEVVESITSAHTSDLADITVWR